MNQNPSVNGGGPPRTTAVGIARGGAEVVSRALRSSSTALHQAVDIDDSDRTVSMPQARDAKRFMRLLSDTDDFHLTPDRRPPVGAPHAEEHWGTITQRTIEAILTAFDKYMRDNHGNVDVIGAQAESADTCLAQAKHALARKRSFASISITGSPKNLLSVGDHHAASISMLVHIPGHPVGASVVTANCALTADCSSAWRLRLPEQEWEEFSKETPRPPADRDHLVLPRAVREHDGVLKRTFPEIHHVGDTSAAITEALIHRSAAAAVHNASPALDCAVVLAAAGHGFTVRPQSERGPVWKDFQVGPFIREAIAKGQPLPSLILGRDETVVAELARQLGGYGYRRQ
ncbi:hypothetical protein [Wenjunlia tyrosinilytica]|uniref:Uncharacterized protein n=1 Tax=Wenjunlia tyrosinilytica TaxID=1544741 RepID=A0A917ZTN5_9ACTN|nr:hypothetical protein [Wenjunlia tyrosinilytica]GGO94688.1 hypothetical protein GCM10012280_50180 [Wenjunlia tyrosinilytica]